MVDINQSASASAEANFAKVSDNTVNIIQAPSSAISGPTGIARLVRTIAPVWYEEREAEALSVRTDSLIETAKRIKEQFPVMSERRAVMEALGYRMTNEQADNVIDVMRQTQEEIKLHAEPVGNMLPEARDAIIEGSKEAYDEKVRTMWSKLVSGEMKSPGTFSKKSMAILSEMSSEEARLFETLCSFCMELNVAPSDTGSDYYDPIVIFARDDESSSSNNGSFPLMDTNRLELLGLFTTSLTRTLTFYPSLPMPFRVGGRIVLLACKGESEVKVKFSAVLTKYGTELSKLCDLGTNRETDGLLRKIAERNGLSMTEVAS